MVVPLIVVIADGVADSSLFFLSERKADDYMPFGTQRQTGRGYQRCCAHGSGKKKTHRCEAPGLNHIVKRWRRRQPLDCWIAKTN